MFRQLVTAAIIVVAGSNPASALDTDGLARPEIISGIYDGQFDLPQPRGFTLNYTVRVLRVLDARCQSVRARKALKVVDAGIIREFMDPRRVYGNMRETYGNNGSGGGRLVADEATIQGWAERDSALLIQRLGCDSDEMKRYVENYVRYVLRQEPVFYSGRNHGATANAVRDACVNTYMKNAAADAARRVQFCDCLTMSLSKAHASWEDMDLLSREFTKENFDLVQKKNPMFVKIAGRCYH